MKITKTQLKRRVKEETFKVLNERDNWWVDEMKRILGEIKKLHDAMARNNSDDLELFEDYFKRDINMNFPWVNK